MEIAQLTRLVWFYIDDFRKLSENLVLDRFYYETNEEFMKSRLSGAHQQEIIFILSVSENKL